MSGPPSPSSLFSLDSEDDQEDVIQSPASRNVPPIPGLYVFPGLLDPTTAHQTIQAIAQADHFSGGTRDQVMLFTRSEVDTTSPHLLRDKGANGAAGNTKLPAHLDTLLTRLSTIVEDKVPDQVHRTVFRAPLARQAILNLYPPGQGITPHVDLANRYADGIVGVSLAGSAVMDFEEQSASVQSEAASVAKEGETDCPGRYSVWLPPRSVYILSGEARWGWTHGIAGRTEDLVANDNDNGQPETILRGLRVSVTFRYLQDGGDLLS